MSIEKLAGQVSSIAVALAFLSLGLRGLLGRRPLVYSARWFVAAPGVFLLEDLIPLLEALLGTGSVRAGSSAELPHAAPSPLVPLLLLAVLAVLWFYSHGYIILGVSDATLRGALRQVLDERGLAHEDRPGSIHIPSLQLDLQLRFNEWGGTAYMKATPARGKPLSRQLSRELKRLFARQPIALSKNAFVMYTWLGALLLGVALFYRF